MTVSLGSGPKKTATVSTPASSRGRRTRTSLIHAARDVFEEKGFDDTRISDITARAGTAYGSFYTYFDSKEAVFRELVKDFAGTVFTATRASSLPDTASAADRIRHTTRVYLETAAEHAPMMLVFEQVAARDPSFRQLFIEVRRLFIERIASATARLQEQGLADPALDPALTATLLGGMIENIGRMMHVFGEKHDLEPVLDEATALWSSAIGLRSEPAQRQ